MFEGPLRKTFGHVSSGLLRKLCPTLPAPLISIGASSGGRTGTSSKRPGDWRSIHDAARNARLSSKACNIMPGIAFR